MTLSLQKFGRVKTFAQPLISPVLSLGSLLLIWQYGVQLTAIPGYILPLPSVIAVRFWQTRADQLSNISATALTTVLGLSFALVVGVFVALVVVYIKPLRSTLMPLLAVFNSIPKIAIAPLLVIWFGLGMESKVVLAFALAVFPVFVNSVSGLGEIDPDVIDLSRLLGGTNWRIFTKVRLINAVPSIVDATKIAFPLALVGSIVGEFIGGNIGAGSLVLSGQFNLDTPLVFATLFSITLFATIGIALISLFERLVLTWRPSARTR